jgi:hypothetical protein
LTPPPAPSPSPAVNGGGNGNPWLGLIGDGHGNYTAPASSTCHTPKECQVISLYQQLIVLLQRWMLLLRTR